MGYTKGEWKADTTDTDVINVFAGSQVVALCRMKGWDLDIKEAKANAQLIVAAPRLHEWIKGKADEGDNDAKVFLSVLGLE